MSCPFTQEDLEALHIRAVPESTKMTSAVRVKLSEMVTHKFLNLLHVLKEIASGSSVPVIRAVHVKQSILKADGKYLVGKPRTKM